MLYFWIAAVVTLIAIEVATPQLVTIWFALGALAALIACIADASIVVQAILFLAVSAVSLIATRPLVKKITKKKFSPTNADRCIGETALVVEDIDNRLEKGAVKINGTVWTARSLDGEPISQNDCVKIERIDGVKLIVTK